MKTSLKKTFLLLALMVGLIFIMVTGRATAQTFINLHNFSGSDGANPDAGLALAGDTLYGTTDGVSSSGWGTVFGINTNGGGFTNLHTFTVAAAPDYTNADGAIPKGDLTIWGRTLYGTTELGGRGFGTVYAVNTDGTGFTNLHVFGGYGYSGEGAYPFGVLLSVNTLYGTAYYGGSANNGILYAVSTNGTDFTNLYNFPSWSGGAHPDGGLILSNNTLYGTTDFGGSSYQGALFAVCTNGSGFTNLHSFIDGNDSSDRTAKLLLSGNIIYGTTEFGGSSRNGTVFAMNTDGTGFTNLHDFTVTLGSSATNSDGANPRAGLILAGEFLYGTATHGGDSGKGTLFAVSTNGVVFKTIYNFSPTFGPSFTNSDGANPVGSLTLLGDTLFGTTEAGGTSGKGTIFSLLLPSAPPQLTITRSKTDFILSWPSNAVEFTLESTTDLGSGIWTTNFPAPVVIDGQNIVTNPITGTQQFFRLSQ